MSGSKAIVKKVVNDYKKQDGRNDAKLMKKVLSKDLKKKK